MAISDFKVLKPANLVEDLVTLIESKLPLLSTSEEFINILEKKKNENQHSLSFCVFMTNECQSNFYFARENSQYGSSVIDIAIYKGGVLIFTIEAKLLPTPEGTKSKPRAIHEYVYGKGAGIQRFKDGHHGRDNSDNLLTESGLIAFVKENDFPSWVKKINQWITEIEWGEIELLKEVYLKSTGKLLSTHARNNSPSILLHHFWVKVS